MVAAIVTGIVDIINIILLGVWSVLATIIICFFLLYFVGFSDEQREKTNEIIIKVIERMADKTKKEKSKWRY